MASSLTRLIRRPVAALFLARSHRHVKHFSNHLLKSGESLGSKPTRECIRFLPRTSPYQKWSRSFASESGDLVDAVVPYMGESITDGTLATFLKKPGDFVAADEPIAQVETDKVTIDVNSPEAGIIDKFIAHEGDTVTPGTKVAVIFKSSPSDIQATQSKDKVVKDAQPTAQSVDAPSSTPVEKIDKQIPKGDVPTKEEPSSPSPSKPSQSEPHLPPKERERRVPMPRLRKRVATRLKDSQNTFAMLTTFNEVDMTNLMKLRSEYKDAFAEKHGVKLGLMSGFVKVDRLHKILECVNVVHSLCVLLGVDFGQTVASVHPSLHDIRGKPSTNISDSTLEELSEAILKLRTEKKIRREKLLEASESLLELWNQMETPDEERKYFEEVICILGSPEDDIGGSGVLTLERIKQMETEVERLTNLKSRRMKELVLRKRAELDEVYQTAHMEPEKSTSPEVSSLMNSGIMDPSELLGNIEMQILKAKEEFLSRKDILEKVNRWLTACDEENWLEDYDQDAKKYSAGRGIHLSLKRAERARVLINKIPDMVDKLMNKIFIWEKERSMPFLYDGVPLVSILEEYKFLRLQKEDLKRRYRDQKKLQNLFPTSKEAVYGAKSTPRSNSFNRKKTDESGFMTPIPRRLSAGSATSELLMQRSYSGCYDAS